MTFKVIIVGGSITGLSLANMLERHGVDYVLLEAYPNIAPQVGASIGLGPNGLRILDQLGCFEQLRDMAGNYYKKMGMRDLEGRVLLANYPSLAEQLENHTGYPMLFIDRQMVLQVLFDKIQRKDKILPGKRVTRVNLEEDLAQVYTQDGSVYHGDIVVGADGVHSVIRAEMWRLAHQLSPGTFDTDEASKLTAEAKCIFGISNIPANLSSMVQQTIIGKGMSYIIVPGPGERLYWFLFVSIPLQPSKDIPRWSKQDEEELAKEHYKDKIADNVTFEDIYNNRMVTALVALEEHVFTRWHFRNIITIGDSAHKVHPLTALGGNGAIESAALLCNALVGKLEQKISGLSDVDIEEAFIEVETLQLCRAQAIVKEGKQSQRWFNQQIPLSGLILRTLLPLVGSNFLFGGLLKVCLQAPKIKDLPVPERPRKTLFYDEILEQPSRRYWGFWSAGVFVLGIVGYYAWDSSI